MAVVGNAVLGSFAPTGAGINVSGQDIGFIQALCDILEALVVADGDGVEGWGVVLFVEAQGFFYEDINLLNGGLEFAVF